MGGTQMPMVWPKTWLSGSVCKKAQRVDESLIAHVTLRGLLDGIHAGEHVSVGVHDALGVAGGAGGEEDLQGRVAS